MQRGQLQHSIHVKGASGALPMYLTGPRGPIFDCNSRSLLYIILVDNFLLGVTLVTKRVLTPNTTTQYRFGTLLTRSLQPDPNSYLFNDATSSLVFLRWRMILRTSPTAALFVFLRRLFLKD